MNKKLKSKSLTFVKTNHVLINLLWGKIYEK